MARLSFKYKTKYTFENYATEHNYKIKCCPVTMDRQHIEIDYTNVTQGDYSSWGTDSFGNVLLYGRISQAHDEFDYEISGTAEVNCGCVDTDDRLAGLFRQQSAYTKPGKLMLSEAQRLRESLAGSAGSRMDVCMETNTYVNKLLTYKQWHTDVSTTAEKALSMGEGVCQDYAHIMTGLLRELGIPARYVVGMIPGEGFSHAWVEAYIDDAPVPGWYGFDPTNNTVADDGYIKISHGRDYGDCILMRGIMRGGGRQTQEVCVSVSDI